MSAPPVLRPLRAILQRRLQIVASRPVRTTYYLRATHYRSQLRYSSSIPPDQPPKPQEEPAQATSSDQNPETEATSSSTPAEETHNATAGNAPPTRESEVEAEASVVTNFHVASNDAVIEVAIPRLDSLLVKSAFQQLKSTDAEIQAGIAEAVARQLAADEAMTVAVGDDAAAELEGRDGGARVPVFTEPDPELTIQEIAEAVESQPEVLVSQETGSASLPSEAETLATVEDVVEDVFEPIASEPVASESAVPEPAILEPAVSEPAINLAMPDLEAIESASPEKIAAMMAYLQTLQARKSPKPAAETAASVAPVEQQKAPESAVSEDATPPSPIAEAVATMNEPVEPAQLETEAPQLAPEAPSLDSVPAEDAIAEAVEESEFIVDPIPDTHSPTEEAVRATTQELERPQTKPEEVVDAKTESPSVSEPSESAAVADTPEQTDTLETAPAAERAVDEPTDEPADEASSVDNSLSTVRDEELAQRDREDHATQLAENEDDLTAFGEDGQDFAIDQPDPSRLPRNVAAYYLQPLRRVAEYGVPACDLQLRSYSVRPLESFCDFALRAAYYLGLPAYGPVPLPKIIERWTVPKSSFIYKKSQENFERITRRRLIQIKDAHPETVQIWLAFLQKHQQAAVGMKANLWEFSSIDVAKQMDEAFKEAEPLINDKYRLLQQNKEFETVEKVDEFLQSERYRVTGDQTIRKQ